MYIHKVKIELTFVLSRECLCSLQQQQQNMGQIVPPVMVHTEGEREVIPFLTNDLHFKFTLAILFIAKADVTAPPVAHR